MVMSLTLELRLSEWWRVAGDDDEFRLARAQRLERCQTVVVLD